jgi:hypothetical protein
MKCCTRRFGGIDASYIPSIVFFGGIPLLALYMIVFEAPKARQEFLNQRMVQITRLESMADVKISMAVENIDMNGVVVPEGVKATQHPKWSMDWTFEGPPKQIAKLLRALYGMERVENVSSH